MYDTIQHCVCIRGNASLRMDSWTRYVHAKDRYIVRVSSEAVSVRAINLTVVPDSLVRPAADGECTNSQHASPARICVTALITNAS